MAFFFDYKKDNWEKDFNFVKNVGLEFMKIFNEIIAKKIRLNGQKMIKKFST